MSQSMNRRQAMLAGGCRSPKNCAQPSLGHMRVTGSNAQKYARGGLVQSGWVGRPALAPSIPRSAGTSVLRAHKPVAGGVRNPQNCPQGYARGGAVRNLKGAAQKLRHMGRQGDTDLVHVNAREKQMLKAAGGRGSVNPRTGLREYVKTCKEPGCGQQFNKATDRRKHENLNHSSPFLSRKPGNHEGIRRAKHVTQNPYPYGCGLASMQAIQEMKSEMPMHKILSKKGIQAKPGAKFLATYKKVLNGRQLNPRATTRNDLVISNKKNPNNYTGNLWADIKDLQGEQKSVRNNTANNWGLDRALQLLKPTRTGDQKIPTYLTAVPGSQQGEHFVNITRVHKKKRTYSGDLMDPLENGAKRFVTKNNAPHVLHDPVTGNDLYDLAVPGGELWETDIT